MAITSSQANAHILSSSPFQPALKNELPNPATPWLFSPEVMKRISSDSANIDKISKKNSLLPSDAEAKFVSRYFLHAKPAGYSIAKITALYNETLKLAFEAELLNTEHEGSLFPPSWKDEEHAEYKGRVIRSWQEATQIFYPFSIPNINSTKTFKHARILPLFHGTHLKKAESISTSGFTYFGKHEHFASSSMIVDSASTDIGWFGSGIYFTEKAAYAAKYSQGCLILSWVSMREPYPVTSDVPHPKKCTEMEKLKGKGAYQNYNAHMVPVDAIYPNQPDCLDYYPCFKDQPPSCTEYVVFQRAQALPCYILELATDSPALQIKSNYSFEEAVIASKNNLKDPLVDWLKEDPSRVTNKGSHGETLLHAAASGGHLPLIQWLDSLDASLIQTHLHDGTTLMHIAAAKGFDHIAQWIHAKDPKQIAAKNKAGKTPLYYAALYQRIPVLKLFIKEILQDPSFLFQQLGEPISDTLQFLLSQGLPANTAAPFKQTLLHLAAQKAQEENVLTLLKFHADINSIDSSGKTPLFLAVIQGHRSMVNLLVKNGASVSIKTHEQENVLHAAAFYGHTLVLRDLLQHTEALDLVHAKDADGKTPLHKACWAAIRADSQVDLLLNHGAAVNAVNNYLFTPLHWASKHGHTRSVISLIKAGANCNLVNSNGHTALDLAIEYGQEEILHLFLRATQLPSKKRQHKDDTKKIIQDYQNRLIQAQSQGMPAEQVVCLVQLSRIYQHAGMKNHASISLNAALTVLHTMQQSHPAYTYFALFKQAIYKRLDNLAKS